MPSLPLRPVAPPAATVRHRRFRGFLHSWKTTTIGVVVLVAAVAPFVPGVPLWVGDVAKAAVPALAGLGFVLAKDADKSRGVMR